MRYLLVSSLVLGLAACDGSVTSRTGKDASTRQDVWNIPDDDGQISTPDTLPAKAGDPCPGQQCATGLICVAAQCRKLCNQPKLGCNHLAPECRADQTCANINSFSDACMPGPATLGQPCALDKQCRGGLLCINLGKGAATCRQLCAASPCPGSEKCVKSTRGCQVCIPK